MTGAAAGEPSIDDVVALQRELGITTHLVYMGRDRFVLAHTDSERSSGGPLDACDVHRALCALDASPVAAAYYRADVVGGRLELTALTDGGPTP
jgi:hypothetical protein